MPGMTLAHSLSVADVRTIQAGITSADPGDVGPRRSASIHLGFKTPEGTLLGGLLAGAMWDWLHVSALWVDASARGQGLGRTLIATAEEVARQQGCRHARLGTFDFQARDFYERQGYHVYATLDGFPTGHNHFHLRKPLCD